MGTTGGNMSLVKSHIIPTAQLAAALCYRTEQFIRKYGLPDCELSIRVMNRVISLYVEQCIAARTKWLPFASDGPLSVEELTRLWSRRSICGRFSSMVVTESIDGRWHEYYYIGNHIVNVPINDAWIHLLGTQLEWLDVDVNNKVSDAYYVEVVDGIEITVRRLLDNIIDVSPMDVWRTELDQYGDINAQLLGDFRILDWEQSKRNTLQSTRF